MKGKTNKRERMSIDVLPGERREIKIFAALKGETIREYVMGSIRERLMREREEAQLSAITAKIGLTLKEVWDNEKDSGYDRL